MSQQGFTGCWKCDEIIDVNALEEIAIADASVPVWLCPSCAADLEVHLNGIMPTLLSLREWRWADEVLAASFAPLADVAPVEEPPPVRIGIAIRDKATGVVLGTVGDEMLALGSKVEAELRMLAKPQEDR